jgi:hypothetical protein
MRGHTEEHQLERNNLSARHVVSSIAFFQNQQQQNNNMKDSSDYAKPRAS